MKRCMQIVVSFGDSNEPEHWLRVVKLPQVHLEPACGACRAESIHAPWDCGRRKAGKARLLCIECQDLLDIRLAVYEAERSLFDDTQTG